ncbi:MAG: CDP-alcohol phosphatidyltransferase family protein [bacterium]
MNLPNFLSMTRLLLVPCFFLALYYYFKGHVLNPTWAQVILAVIVTSDFLDGWLARRRGEVTTLGSILDPLADKLFVTASFILLSVFDRIPAWLTILVVTKDILVSIGWCVQVILYNQVEVNPSLLGKTSTGLQFATVVAVIFHFPAYPSRGLQYVTGLMTVLALLHYVYLALQHTNGSTGKSAQNPNGVI